MKIDLIVRCGQSVGRVIPVYDNQFLIGLDPVCSLRPNSPGVSDFHCVFITDASGLSLRDLGSVDGTFVNGERLQSQIIVESGDYVRVGNLEFEVAISDRLIDCLSLSQSESRIRCRIGEIPTISLEHFGQRLRNAFETNHLVFCPSNLESRLAAQLALGNQQIVEIVGRGFAHVIILDVAKACDESGVFEIDMFWKNTFVTLARKLGLDVPTSHHNDRSCIEFLLDLPRSLLCLLNMDRAPQNALGSLRSITQEKHPALIQYCTAKLHDSETQVLSSMPAHLETLEANVSDSWADGDGDVNVNVDVAAKHRAADILKHFFWPSKSGPTSSTASPLGPDQ